jgi:hypothetical protein
MREVVEGRTGADGLSSREGGWCSMVVLGRLRRLSLKTTPLDQDKASSQSHWSREYRNGNQEASGLVVRGRGSVFRRRGTSLGLTGFDWRSAG